MVRDEVKDFDTKEGTIERRRIVQYQLCGPTEVTSATKFIVITKHIEQSEYYKPDFEDPEYAYNDSDRRSMERKNQEARMETDKMILIAITAGEPNLSL